MKYTLIDDTFDHYGRTLHRIKALKNFGNVKAGDIGGYVQSLDNLNQDGNCWIYDDAKAYGNARVFGNSEVYDDAIVSGNVEVLGCAKVFGNAIVSGYATVFDNAIIYDDAKVSGNAIVFGNAIVSGNARVSSNAEVSGYARIFGDSITTSSVQSVITHKHNITVTDNNIIIGCQCHSIEHWQKNIDDIGKKHKYSVVEIDGIKLILNGLFKVGGKDVDFK